MKRLMILAILVLIVALPGCAKEAEQPSNTIQPSITIVAPDAEEPQTEPAEVPEETSEVGE